MAVEKIVIPDFGDVQQITVVEVFVAPGDRVEKEASLIALESEKAVMDIPSPFAGVIKEVLVKEEDAVKSGDVIALIETAAAEHEAGGRDKAEPVLKPAIAEADQEPEAVPAAAAEPDRQPRQEQNYHASPSVRALAREMQVELSRVVGTGPNGRILKEDLLAVLKKNAPAVAVPAAAMPSPLGQQQQLEDFARYGEVEEVALGRIKKISGPHLHESWIAIPHVTHFDETDISDLERFRKELNGSRQEGEPSYSPLIFVIRAVAATLKQFPLFNCSLAPGGEKVIVKKYYHLGIAVDTPGGLVVPVIKDADRRGLKDLAAELHRLSTAARAGKLAIPEIQGATFTISSLGGIGGTGFTPIISSPQAAILGLSRSFMKPVWDSEAKQFMPRLTLPFSLSYDHRIIDGAQAARFCKALRQNIEDLKRTLV